MLIRIPMIAFFIAISLFVKSSTIWGADFHKGLQAYKSKNFLSAYQEWKPLAKMGSAHAQSNLGVMFSQGTGVPKDDKMAVTWWRRAATIRPYPTHQPYSAIPTFFGVTHVSTKLGSTAIHFGIVGPSWPIPWQFHQPTKSQPKWSWGLSIPP